MRWIVSLILASTSWAVAEVLTDMCVQHDEEDEDEEDKDQKSEGQAAKTLPLVDPAAAKLFSVAIKPAVNSKLSGEQATFVAGMTMIPCMGLMAATCPVTLFDPGNTLWWLAMLAGFIAAAAGLLLYKAYESIPSTVIVPLIQLTAVMVLPLSALKELIAGNIERSAAGAAVVSIDGVVEDVTASLSIAASMLHGKDLVAYIFILLGGLIPASEGNMKVFLQPSFWKQKHVLLILAVDVLFALNNELTETCTTYKHPLSPEQFMVIQTLGMILVYAVVFLTVGRLRREAATIHRVYPRAIVICIASEALNFVGFYLASYAYAFHGASNIGVINASEVALIQIMNLLAAYVFRKCFGAGRISAVSGMWSKMFGCVAVTFGITLANMNYTS